MREPVVRGVGLAVVLGYAALIAWLFASQPRTMAEAVGGLSANLGTYGVDDQAFADGLAVSGTISSSRRSPRWRGPIRPLATR